MKSLTQSYKEEIDRISNEEPPVEIDYKYYKTVIDRQK